MHTYNFALIELQKCLEALIKILKRYWNIQKLCKTLISGNIKSEHF